MQRVGCGRYSTDPLTYERLESSAHASSLLPAKASLDSISSAVRQQTRWKKIVPDRDPALTPLLGDHSSFSYLIGAQMRRGFFVPALRMSAACDGGVGTRAEGGTEVWSTRGVAGRGRGRG